MEIAPFISALLTLAGAGIALLPAAAVRRRHAPKRASRGREPTVRVNERVHLNDVRSLTMGLSAKTRLPTAGWARTAQRARIDWTPGLKVLVAFAAVVFVYGVVTLVQYWSFVEQNRDQFFYAFGLFLTMIFGMFVQVLAANYRSGQPLFDVTSSQLLFPLLFSLVVYYPIWAITASASHGLFPFHAAFLNGYFWESVVSAASSPTPPTNQPRPALTSELSANRD